MTGLRCLLIGTSLGEERSCEGHTAKEAMNSRRRSLILHHEDSLGLAKCELGRREPGLRGAHDSGSFGAMSSESEGVRIV